MKFQASTETTEIFRELLKGSRILWSCPVKNVTEVPRNEGIASNLFLQAIREKQEIRRASQK
jgi:hypothetical protein